MIVTLTLFAAAAILSATPDAVGLLELDRAAVAAGEWWRVLSGHLVHASTSIAAWDLAAFLGLGLALERRSRRMLVATLALSAVFVSLAVLAGRPDLDAYRGLSGVDTALFGALAASLVRAGGPTRWIGGLALLGALVKVTAEWRLGAPIFAADASGFAPVPLAHVAGLVIGVGVQFLPTLFRTERTMNRLIKTLSAALGLAFFATGAHAEDRYVTVPLQALPIEAGQLPRSPERAWWGGFGRNRSALMIPRVVLDGPGEAYVDRAPGSNELVLVARIPDGGAGGGELFIARDDFEGMQKITFRLPAAGGEEAEASFKEIAASHFDHLTQSGTPGGAWFRYRAHVLRGPAAHASATAARADDAALEQLRAVGATPQPERRARPSDLEQTYGLFTGARSMAENLQLDNILVVAEAGDATVDVGTLDGITVQELEWGPLVEGKDPEIDPLATRIPSDQHALFFPSFGAMVRLIDEATQLGTPLLRLLEEQAIDAATRQRYEAQLGLELDAFARTFGPLVVKSVAVTGSDPYLRTGSDVAVLLECAEPEAMLALLSTKHAAMAKARPDAASSRGEIGGLAWTAVATKDRAISSFVMRDGDVVLVTNSSAQLERYGAVRDESAPSLGGLPEFTFFRDRYARGDAAETAFFFLSDATIRRWCSPKWRIGASRRIRAQAVLAHEAARRQDVEAGGAAVVPPIDPRIPDMYGTLTFVTPVAELDLDRVTEPEAEAYRRFRNNYQRNWRQFFDPIGVRIGVEDGVLETDVTVMPMIDAADAREWMELTRGAALEPGDGDPHDGVLFQYVQAIDLQADPVREMRSFASGMMPGVDPFGWVGDHVSFFIDDDPVFDDPKMQADPEEFFEENLERLPFGLVVAVADPLKVALFLTALRSFSEQAAPGVLSWENIIEGEQTYVKVTARENPRGGSDDDALSICYAVLPGRLVVTPNEPLLKRAIARATATEPEAAPVEWPGRHVAVRLDGRVGALLEGMFGEWQEENQRAASWRNLFILNEWRRTCPNDDPVAVHERRFGQRLVCPGGGDYVWNAQAGTMESTAYGHPAAPRSEATVAPLLASIADAVAGVTFENDGLRARATLERKVDD